jgi:hypothetical protein
METLSVTPGVVPTYITCTTAEDVRRPRHHRMGDMPVKPSGRFFEWPAGRSYWISGKSCTSAHAALVCVRSMPSIVIQLSQRSVMSILNVSSVSVVPLVLCSSDPRALWRAAGAISSLAIGFHDMKFVTLCYGKDSKFYKFHNHHRLISLIRPL